MSDHLPNRNRLPVNPSAEYQAIIAEYPQMRTWYDFHSNELPRLLQSNGHRKALNNVIAAYLREHFNIAPNVPLPTVNWVVDDPAVIQTTGGQFAIPTMYFSPPELPLFNHIAGDNQTAGMTVTLPIEFISQGQISSRDSLNSQLVLLPDSTIQYPIPYGERSQHERIHAVDPLVDIRPFDRVVLRELVALIGSFSDQYSRHTSIVLHPPYIVPYVLQEASMQGQRLTQDQLSEMVNLINSLVYNSTHLHPKTPNDQITRRIMKCKSLDELYATWPEIFPEGYNYQEKDIVLEPV